MKKWILFDIDDVLVNFRQSMYNACKSIRDIHWTEWTSGPHHEIYGFESQEHLREYMCQMEVLENAKVEAGVKNVLQLLRDAGYSIGLISARGWHPKGDIITQRMIKDNDLAVDKVVLSYVYTDKKSDFLHEFDGEIIAYLDDTSHHVQDFINNHIKSYLMNRPWNVDEVELPRVHSILQFLEVVRSLETPVNSRHTELQFA